MNDNPVVAADLRRMVRDAGFDESRIDIAQKGLYDKRGLKVIKKIRCSVNPGDPECSTCSEEDWK